MDMALFESYERRIDQINAALNKYGIKAVSYTHLTLPTILLV